MSETVLGHFHNEWDLPASLDPPPVKVLLNITTAVPKLNPSTCSFPFAIAFLFYFFLRVCNKSNSFPVFENCKIVKRF